MTKKNPCDCDFCLREDAEELRKTIVHIPPNWTTQQMERKYFEKLRNWKRKSFIRGGDFYLACTII